MLPIADFSSPESLLKSIDHIAHKLAHDLILQINDAQYRIVDFEFYVKGTALEDPHTYNHALQRQHGKLYLHASGIDITFGDATHSGGILLRSVIAFSKNAGPEGGFFGEGVEGPQNVATELMSHLHPLTEDKPNVVRLLDVDGNDPPSNHYKAFHLFASRRIGLTPKAADAEGRFLDEPLRYVALMQRFKNFRHKPKGLGALVKKAVEEGKQWTIDELKSMLDYVPAWAKS